MVEPGSPRSHPRPSTIPPASNRCECRFQRTSDQGGKLKSWAETDARAAHRGQRKCACRASLTSELQTISAAPIFQLSTVSQLSQHRHGIIWAIFSPAFNRKGIAPVVIRTGSRRGSGIDHPAWWQSLCRYGGAVPHQQASGRRSGMRASTAIRYAL